MQIAEHRLVVFVNVWVPRRWEASSNAAISDGVARWARASCRLAQHRVARRHARRRRLPRRTARRERLRRHGASRGYLRRGAAAHVSCVANHLGSPPKRSFGGVRSGARAALERNLRRGDAAHVSCVARRRRARAAHLSGQESGGDGDRTHYLLHAMQALYQLSYAPDGGRTIPAGSAGPRSAATTLWRVTGAPTTSRSTATTPRSRTRSSASGRTAGTPSTSSGRRTAPGCCAEDPRRVADRPQLFVLDMFPYPSGAGPPRRSSARLHRHRRVRALQAHERLQRAARDGLRRVRPARPSSTRCRPGSTRASRPRRTSPTCGASCARSGSATTRAAGRRPPTSTTTAGRSGSSCRSTTPGTTTTRTGPGRSSELVEEFRGGPRPDARRRAVRRARRRSSSASSSTRTGSRTSTRRRSTGAPGSARCSPTKRSPPTAAASAATSRSTGAR